MILVTGSSGYLGGSFIEKYNDDYKFQTFSKQNSHLEHIDFSNLDIVLHCAALVHQKVEVPYTEYYDINVMYPVELAKKAKKEGLKQFIFISTIAVYGENMEYLTEEKKCYPTSSYAKSKLEAEQLLQELNDENFIVSIIRPPMIYGHNAPGNIASLIKLIKKINILPFANIKNKRNFIYIGNLISLIDTIICQHRPGIFLASDDTSLSTTQLIELIATNLNRKIYLLDIPFFKMSLKFLKPSLYKKLYGNLEIDNAPTLRLLNYKNTYQTEEGIELMIKGISK